MSNKISTAAANAFNSNENFKSKATEVKAHGLITRLFLYGHCIATKCIHPDKNYLEINHCGWKTKTTKERLNALPGVSIVQKSGKWYVNGIEWTGETFIIY